jgi:hypothetical protein
VALPAADRDGGADRTLLVRTGPVALLTAKPEENVCRYLTKSIHAGGHALQSQDTLVFWM